MKLLLDLLFPIECLGCGADDVWLCSNCVHSVPIRLSRHCPFCENPTAYGETCASCRPRYALDGALSGVPYSQPLIQKIIHTWKYQGIKNLSAELGLIIGRALAVMDSALQQAARKIEQGFTKTDLHAFALLPTLITRIDTILVPVPLHKRRARERGFNQAADLAQAISEQKSWSVWPLINRTRATTAQATLTGSDRYTNIKEAFVLASPPIAIQNKSFLLVDDVITTGSTCEALAKLLKAGGARSVWALTIAYGHPVK